MQTTIFTDGHVRFFMRRQDIFSYNLGATDEEIEASIHRAATALNSPAFTVALSAPFRPSSQSKDLLFKPLRFEDKLYIRHLNHRLCRCYNIRHANRHEIVRQVKELMQADANLKVVRADITRFFRNINFQALIEHLRIDGRLSSSEIDSLAAIAAFTGRFQRNGVPWGLSISSTLAEIYLRDFDIQMRRCQGVYYYQRFVDDMIFFTTSPPEILTKLAAETLSKIGLRLNPEKTASICEAEAGPIQFCYLGYKLQRGAIPKNGATKILVTIAPSKIDRIKQRISDSISCFYRDRNPQGLKDRLKVLTGNYTINKSSHEAPIRTGIYFNYMEINDKSQLSLLDDFLRSRLCELRAYLHRKGMPPYSSRMHDLYRFSFVSGFNNKIIHRIAPLRLNQIINAWSE